MQYVLGLIAALAGGLFFYRSKAKTAESLNANIETKEKVIKEDAEIAKDQGKLEAESGRREAISDTVQKEVEKELPNESLVNFLNSIKPRK